MDLVVGAPPDPLVWDERRYYALMESGVLDEGRGVELLNGQVIHTMPQGGLHLLVLNALQDAFAAMEGAGRVRSGSTIRLNEINVVDPELARYDWDPTRSDLPTAADTDWVIEVSVTSLGIDLNAKKDAYAEAGVPEYWVFDVPHRRLHVFRDPKNGVYTETRVLSRTESVPVPGGTGSLDLGPIFAAADRKG
jgi:Uma2 family endonuclease